MLDISLRHSRTFSVWLMESTSHTWKGFKIISILSSVTSIKRLPEVIVCITGTILAILVSVTIYLYRNRQLLLISWGETILTNKMSSLELPETLAEKQDFPPISWNFIVINPSPQLLRLPIMHNWCHNLILAFLVSVTINLFRNVGNHC